MKKLLDNYAVKLILDRFWYPESVQRNKILKMNFLYWFFNLIMFKDTNDSISNSRKNVYCPWCNLAIKICKISPLNTPEQPLRKSKELGDAVYNTSERVWKANKYRDVGWLLLMSPDKVVKRKIGIKFPAESLPK